jgi:sugar O-acyltransferase (sialic acid O-acetyltransferase NeuD family)
VKNKVVILGDGGHAISVADVLFSRNEFELMGVFGLDEKNSLFWETQGVHWYHESKLPSVRDLANLALIGIGQIFDPQPRVRAFNSAVDAGFKLLTLVSPYAYVSKNAMLGQGTVVMHGSIINAFARVGENSIINSRALLEHGATVGDHSHISTGAILNGESSVGDESFIGSGAILKQGVSIGNKCVVSMGSRIKTNLPEGQIFRTTGHVES